jgi:hypothetical protein
MSIQGQRCHEFDLLVLVAFVTELHTLRLSGRASGTRSLEDTCSRRERDYRCLLQGPRKILQDLERVLAIDDGRIGSGINFSLCVPLCNG